MIEKKIMPADRKRSGFDEFTKSRKTFTDEGCEDSDSESEYCDEAKPLVQKTAYKQAWDPAISLPAGLRHVAACVKVLTLLGAEVSVSLNVSIDANTI